MLKSCLKSNMDRFIVIAIIAVTKLLGRLKSNMDRFIAKCSPLFNFYS